MKYMIATFVSGLLFALGLGISGMTDPSKVTGFLNVAGDWNPALMFVMVGAIGVHAMAYRLITKRSSPVLAATFKIPSRRDIDKNLVIGSVMFGAGWGLLGYCPGPAFVSLVTLDTTVITFVASSFIGMGLHRAYKKFQGAPKPEQMVRASTDNSVDSGVEVTAGS